MFYAAKFFSDGQNWAKMLLNVVQVYTIDLEITWRNYLVRKLKNDPVKGTIFAKKKAVLAKEVAKLATLLSL